MARAVHPPEESALRPTVPVSGVPADPAGFFEVAAVGAVQVDVTTRRFLRANRHFTEMIGYSEAELRGMSFIDLSLPEDVERSVALFGEALRGDRTEFTIEKQLRRKDGTQLWANIGVAILRDAAGNPQRTLAIVQDIDSRKTSEAGLRASEQQLAAIFASAAAGLIELSLDGHVMRANDEFCRMVGRPRSTLLGLSVLDVTYPDDHVTMLRGIGELLHTGGRVSLEHRCIRPDGGIVWANSQLTRLDDAATRPEAVLAVTVDLTERRAAERAIAESEAKFRMLAEASPAVIWFIDANRDTRFVNRRYLEFFGQTETEVFSRGWRPPIHADDRERYEAELSLAVRERRPLLARVRVRRHDGAWRWIELQAAPRLDSDGNYLGHVGHSLDITELAETSEALRASDDRLRRATEIETVGIAFFDRNGRVTQTNAAFLKMSGYSDDDVRSGLVRLDQLTPVESRLRVTHALDEVLALGRTQPYELESIRKDGSRWWGLHAATRLSANEGVEFVIDITARRHNEEELRGYREELETRVLHRTAELDGVNGALRGEILERKRAEETRHDLLRRLVSAQEEERRRISRELHDQVGQNLTALMLGLKALEQLRDSPASPHELHRLQELTQRIGKQIHDMALDIRPTALDDLGLLRTLSNYVAEWSKRSGIEVDFLSSGWEGKRSPSHVETAIYRIVREALNNIVKHAAAKRVSLIIERHASQAVAIVEDDGKGFEPEVALSNRNRLGLVGMRERATLAGGELSIESSPGSGTTVFLRVPLQPSHDNDNEC